MYTSFVCSIRIIIIFKYKVCIAEKRIPAIDEKDSVADYFSCIITYSKNYYIKLVYVTN